MPPSPPGRAIFLMLLAGLAASAAGCNRQNDGAVKVAVIGETPTVVDPATRPLSPGEALLLANVAQGLVRFDARGQIEPGLAERWNVSDDGLSYIFRLASGEWAGGGKISAHQVARLLRRSIALNGNNPLKDTLGAVDEIVAMTDRVLEIRLKTPRPNLLQLLAQPELALVRNGQGAGPFMIAQTAGPSGELRLARRVAGQDGEESTPEELRIRAMAAPRAVDRFASDEVDLVTGGTFTDLPFARAPKLPRNSLRFDPVAGLFGLVPARKLGPLADADLRRLLLAAIDRDALLAALDVPGLIGRATLLEAGLDGVPDPVIPPWMGVPIGDRRPALMAEADRLFGGEERPTIRIALPDGPGARLLLNRLAQDWGLLGIRVAPAAEGEATDLRIIDAVAPSISPAWFLRQFRCDQVPICDPEADALLDAARAAPVSAQRGALLAEAARRMDEMKLFLAIAAPIRWSLVSDRIEGFAGNRFGRHTLTALEEKLNREGAD